MSKQTKREALQRMMGQAKLMEIINTAYDNADNCQNCKALAEWWEIHGSSIPTPEVPGIGRKSR